MLTTIDHTRGRGRVRELRLARPPVNALNPSLMDALRVALSNAVSDGCAGVVLSGAPGRFSGGLDVPELLGLDRQGLRAAWESFFALMTDLANLPIPIAAAMTGHSPAGGTVLAILTDYRVLAEGRFVVGLNEVQVGLPVPEVLFVALTRVVGARQAERLAVAGLLLDPAEAVQIGLVDAVVPVDEVIPRALAWVEALLERPPQAMTATRHLARASLRAAFETVTPRLLDDIADSWFAAETQVVLRTLAAKLGKPA